MTSQLHLSLLYAHCNLLPSLLEGQFQRTCVLALCIVSFKILIYIIDDSFGSSFPFPDMAKTKRFTTHSFVANSRLADYTCDDCIIR